MRGYLFLVACLSGPCGSGPAGLGCVARKAGWLTVFRGMCFSREGVGLSGAGIGDAPAAGGLLRPCGCGGLVGGGCPCVCVGVACCRGSGVVRPGCLTRLGS